MRYYKYSFLFIALILLGCERDDICAEGTPTTPRLLIEFFDAIDTETLKSVTRLSVYGEDLVTENGAIVLPEVSTSASLIFNSNSNAIELPLLVGEEGVEITTRYILEKDTNLRIDGDVATDSNVDILVVRYIPQFVYVSRACGFKSIFTNLEVSIESNDASQWIQNIAFANTTDTQIIVENEDATHVQIFH
ncbi:DUF6452 family protein [Winogradskyella haliclonae]|uniref:Uncharacterized protein n=1 Tax=Winogradskyella haliclonae TaxID=2048558 RepID=A0ABQ2BZ71_9FLAO|nr:DUF6452 family protein [Winogradskyella haliclonae]GGI57790.1 hypothetical protein GCM10011444_20990 [Winogradskyella haliclonae]